MFESLFTGFSLDDADQKSADSANGLQRFLKLIAWYSRGYIDYFWGLKVYLSVLQLHNVKKAALNEARDILNAYITRRLNKIIEKKIV